MDSRNCFLHYRVFWNYIKDLLLHSYCFMVLLTVGLIVCTRKLQFKKIEGEAKCKIYSDGSGKTRQISSLYHVTTLILTSQDLVRNGYCHLWKKKEHKLHTESFTNHSDSEIIYIQWWLTVKNQMCSLPIENSKMKYVNYTGSDNSKTYKIHCTVIKSNWI